MRASCVPLIPALVCLVLSVPALAASRSVLVWQEKLPGLMAPDRIRDLVAKAGLPVDTVDGAALSAPGRLDPKRVGLLVLPYGPRYPAPAREAILAYLRGGGALLALGGRAFTEPLFPTKQVADRSRSFRRATVAQRPTLRGDGERTTTSCHLLRSGWASAGDLRRPAPGDALRIACPAPPSGEPDAVTASDREGTPEIRRASDAGRPVIEAHSRGLSGYEYLLLRIPPGDAGRPLLRLRARGDGSTPLLCIEAGETDGSRWKAVVPLTPKWATVRIHAAEFQSYASPKRAGSGDRLHPEAVRELRFGYTTGMVGAGAHRFALGDVAWEPAASTFGAASAAPLVRDGAGLVERFFGASLVVPSGGELPLFPNPTPLSASARLVAAHPLAPPAPPGKVRGWQATGWSDDGATAWAKNPGGRLLLPRQATGRRVTLLEARGAGGESLGPAFSLLVHARGEFAGGRWAFSGLETPAPFGGGAGADAAFVRLVRALVASPLLAGIRPEFGSADGKAALRPVVQVAGAPAGDAAGEVRIRVLPLKGSGALASETASATVPAGKSVAVNGPSVPLDLLDAGGYRLETSLRFGGEEVDRAPCTVDLAGTLRLLCGEFLRRQQKDGTYSGVAFSDSRAARTLLAMHAITGERRYLNSALRWGAVTLERQREDGGYRMGYGISAAGEECYVADGGEIALGIVRLALDAPAADRPRYRKSLERYLRFREEFRCPEGGIGVGYCKSDYGARPVVPLKEIRRIYAPELNTYTIGCTLGAASACAALLGGQAERDRAAGDARWLMARTKSGVHGAFAESFVWAHALLPDPALRAEIEALLRERLLATAGRQTDPWWLWGGGRSALNLGALAYASQTLGSEAGVRAEVARALYALCGDESPWSLHRLCAEPAWLHNDWIYASYAGVSLVDVLRPGVSLPSRGR